MATMAVVTDKVYLTKDGTLSTVNDLITSASDDIVDIDTVDFTESIDRKLMTIKLPVFGKENNAPVTKFVDLGQQDWLLTIKGKLVGDSNRTRYEKYEKLRNLLISGSTERTIKIIWKDQDSDATSEYLSEIPYNGAIRRFDVRKYQNLQWYDVTLVFMIATSLF